MNVRAQMSRVLQDWYGSIRFEHGPWPLFRADQGLRYGLKSVLHRPDPATAADRAHHEAVAGWLRRRTWSTAEAPLRLSCVGDMMWTGGSWSDPLSRGVAARLARADVRFANLETPIDPAGPVPTHTYASFNAPRRFLDPWRDGVPTVLSLCNNHALDRDLRGLHGTRTVVEGYDGLVPVGGTRPEHAVSVLTVRGVRIAVISWTWGVNPWGHRGAIPAGLPVASADHPGPIDQLIARARATSPDLIVAIPHWGYEFEYWPEAVLREHAYRLFEAGVDVLVGSSPHVLHPVEVVSLDGWDSDCPVQLARGGAPRPGILLSSLGNFVGTMPTIACRTGAIVELHLSLVPGGGLDLHRLHAHPTVCVGGGLTGRAPRTVTLPELAACGLDPTPFAAHALRMLGPVLAPPPGQEPPRV